MSGSISGLSLGDACRGLAPPRLPWGGGAACSETGDTGDTEQTTAVDAATGEPGLGPRVGEGREGLARRGQAELEGAEEDLLGAGPLSLNFPEATE